MSATAGATAAVVFWFRRGLRLHDNPALLAAAQDGGPLYPVFVLDPSRCKPGARCGPTRLRFLFQSLQDLDKSLRAHGTRLVVLRGNPREVLVVIAACTSAILKANEFVAFQYQVFPRVFDEWKDIAEKKGVQVVAKDSCLLYNPDDTIAAAGGKAPASYGPFVKMLARMGPPPEPLAAPGKLPAMGPLGAFALEQTEPPSSVTEFGHEELGPCRVPGGEVEGLLRLDEYMSKKEWVAKFEKPKTDPSAFEPPGTTVLSPYLMFGCVSARLFYIKLRAIGPRTTQPPVSLLGQLYWREFFYTVGYNTKHFDAMEGNALCKQVPWNYDKSLSNLWAEGRTGYPWIDAIMIQLKTEGWMHHLARHAVACFLTRGDLLISWELGRDVFEHYLLDADWSINNGNWLWLSASAFFHQFQRVYSPISFGRKYDKGGKFIRKYIPALCDMPSAYIYEPWTAPLEVQKKANCIIGKDYPAPVVDHKAAMKHNMGVMAEAYKAAREHREPEGLQEALRAANDAYKGNGDAEKEHESEDEDITHHSESEDDAHKPRTRKKARQG
eukprot:jgi/Chlat1/5283/Chrsp35S05193